MSDLSCPRRDVLADRGTPPAGSYECNHRSNDSDGRCVMLASCNAAFIKTDVSRCPRLNLGIDRHFPNPFPNRLHKPLPQLLASIAHQHAQCLDRDVSCFMRAKQKRFADRQLAVTNLAQTRRPDINKLRERTVVSELHIITQKCN